jgi:hypothetical protein
MVSIRDATALSIVCAMALQGCGTNENERLDIPRAENTTLRVEKQIPRAENKTLRVEKHLLCATKTSVQALCERGCSLEAFHACVPLVVPVSDEARVVRSGAPIAKESSFIDLESQSNLAGNQHTWENEGWAVLKGAITDDNVINSIVNDTKFQNMEGRLQDMWSWNPGAKSIALDGRIQSWLRRLVGRNVRPMQTLNFKYGTSQRIHSDLIHFSTFPQGLMLGVWVALEDIHVDSGPLLVYPGSHKTPMVYFDDLGINSTALSQQGTLLEKGYAQYEQKLQEQVLSKLPPPKMGIIKKGDAFVWNGNLYHGGSPIVDPSRTRMSQVTHYFMDGANSYWTPRVSDINTGHFHWRGGPTDMTN